MRDKRFIVGVVMVLAAAAPALAQGGGGCTLKVGEGPEIRGLRLGMSTAQLRARHPGLPALRPDEFGQSHVRLDLRSGVGGEAFAGVTDLRLNFIDDRLVEYQVTYADAPWENIDQFLAKLGESLSLPAGWTDAGEKRRKLVCDGLQLDVGAASWSAVSMAAYVAVREVGAEAVIARRVAEKRERQRQTFKP